MFYCCEAQRSFTDRRYNSSLMLLIRHAENTLIAPRTPCACPANPQNCLQRKKKNTPGAITTAARPHEVLKNRPLPYIHDLRRVSPSPSPLSHQPHVVAENAAVHRCRLARLRRAGDGVVEHGFPVLHALLPERREACTFAGRGGGGGELRRGAVQLFSSTSSCTLQKNILRGVDLADCLKFHSLRRFLSEALWSKRLLLHCFVVVIVNLFNDIFMRHGTNRPPARHSGGTTLPYNSAIFQFVV